MNEAAERNRKKQLKNAKRGGYTPTIAKDVNKHKIQKLQRMISDLRKEGVRPMSLTYLGRATSKRYSMWRMI